MNGREIVEYAWKAMMLVGLGVIALWIRDGNRDVRAWLRALGGGRPKAAMGFDPRRGVDVKTHAGGEDGDDG